MTFNSRPTASKRQRELDQKDRANERAARRADRKARAADRAATGQVGPPMGEPIAPAAGDPVAMPWSSTEDRSRPSPARESTTGNRLYVGNLSFDTDADAVRELFAGVGTVSDVHIVTDRDTGRPRGFAFVTMATGAEAQKAIAELDGAALDNRQLRVNQAEERQGGGNRGRSRY